jgi:hypothetical protein
MSRNREIAAAFGAQLDPPRDPVQVRNINGIPRRDAWMIAMFDAAADVGITAHVFGSQQLHAFVEVLGGSEDAGRVSRLLASVAKTLKDERDTTIKTGPAEGDVSGSPAQPAEGHSGTGERAQEGHAEPGEGEA